MFWAVVSLNLFLNSARELLSNCSSGIVTEYSLPLTSLYLYCVFVPTIPVNLGFVLLAATVSPKAIKGLFLSTCSIVVYASAIELIVYLHLRKEKGNTI